MKIQYPGIARTIDADIQVVSLEPASVEGIFNTITTVGALTDAEDAAVDLVESLRTRLGEVQRSCLDVSRARSELGWSPTTKLRDGLELTLAAANAEAAAA